MLVQVRFGFTKMKRFIRVYGSGSGSVRHPGFALFYLFIFIFWHLLAVLRNPVADLTIYSYNENNIILS